MGATSETSNKGRKPLESLDLVSPNTMRLMLMTGVAAAMFLDPRASHAHEGPWCALTNIGGGTMYENMQHANLASAAMGGRPRRATPQPSISETSWSAFGSGHLTTLHLRPACQYQPAELTASVVLRRWGTKSAGPSDVALRSFRPVEVAWAGISNWHRSPRRRMETRARSGWFSNFASALRTQTRRAIVCAQNRGC